MAALALAGLGAFPSLAGAQTVAVPVAADTYLGQLLANLNHGQENVLRVQQLGRNRTLVRMDQTAIASAVGSGSLVSATLELYATSSGNWSLAGRTVDLHRLNTAWTETGATWSCPNDTIPINLLPNCPAQWGGGTFEEEASDSVLHTNATSGYVRFNVTEDVRSFLAGTSNFGWLAKLADETAGGNVGYASREGLSARRPRLVLVVESPPVDPVPPSLAITAPEGTIYNDAAPQIRVEYSDADSGVDLSTLRASLDGGNLECTPAASGAVCQAPYLEAGTHQLQAEVRDLAGNLATAAATFNLIVDEVAPAVSFTAPGRPEYYPEEIPAVQGTIVENGSGLAPATFRVSVDGQDVTSTCTVTAASFQCPTPGLAEGPHVVAAAVEDLAGNSGEATAELRVVEDLSGPVVRITSPAETVEGTNRPRIVAEYADDRSGVDLATLTLQVDDVDLTATCDVQATAVDCLSPVLAEGTHTVTVGLSDSRGNRSEDRQPFTLTLSLAIAVTAPGSGTVTREAATRLEGTVSPLATSVKVGETEAVVSGGVWVADAVPLREGSNALTAVARSSTGGIGSATVTVIRDTEAPRVAILSPRNGFVTSASQIVVTGDLVDSASSSAEQRPLTVRVNDQVPMVERKSFVLPDLLLVPGENRIEVMAEDAAGNVGRSEVTVQYVPDAAARIEKISGDFQEAPAQDTLPQPLVVQVVDFTGRPLAGRTVDFAVTRGDGAVISFPDAARKLSVTTDAEGLAVVQFALGTRAGAGNQEVTASSLGIPGSVVFCASARTRAAEQIHPIVGTDFQGARSGAAGWPLPKPLLVQVFDGFGNPVPGVEVTFRSVEGGGSFAGAAEIQETTDEEGKAGALYTLGPGEGINNNVAEAAFAGSKPARFVISGMVPGPAELTSISGVLLDPQDAPVPGAGIHVGDNEVLTDAEGKFRLSGVPVGTVHLGIDGATVTRPGTWPHLGYELVTVSGRDNTLGKPLRLPQLDDEGKKWVGGNEDVVVPIRGVAGATLTVFANSATFPDGSREGWVSFTQVPSYKVPMVAPMNTNFQLAWSVQPAGVRFDPPARVSIPNFGGAASGGNSPGMTVEIFSFDHDLEEFVSAGTAAITEDGQRMVSNPGMGISKAGWGGCPRPPSPPAGACSPGNPPGACKLCPAGGGPPVSQCTSCQVCTGNGCIDKSLDGYEIFFEQDDSDPGDTEAVAALQAATKAAAPGTQKIGLNAQVTFNARQIIKPPGICKQPVFEWDFGDGQSGQGPTPTHRYKKRGPYTVTLTLRCKDCPDLGPITKTRQVEVEAKVMVNEVVSNQVPGVDCNMLPPKVFPGKNVPMLIGAKSGNRISVIVRGVIQPPSARPLTRIGAREAGKPEIINSATPPGLSGPTTLEFDAEGGENDYEIVAGFDENGSGKLEMDEVEMAFPQKLKAITADDYAENKGQVEFSRDAIMPAGGAAEGLVNVFLGVAGGVPGTTTQPDVMTLGDIEHPTGVNWTPACTAPITSYVFGVNHVESQEFAQTFRIRDKVYGVIRSRYLASVRSYFQATPGPVGQRVRFPQALGLTWPMTLSTTTREWLLDTEFDIALSFGGLGRIDGEILHADFIRQDGGQLVLVSLRYRGAFRDPYDFDVTDTLPVIPYHITEDAALVQTGYPTLGAAGAVLSDRMSFDVQFDPPSPLFVTPQ